MIYDTDTVGGRIAWAIKNAGFASQSAFAREIQAKPTMVNRWINNPERGIDRETFRLIEKKTGARAIWLEHGEEPRLITDWVSRGTGADRERTPDYEIETEAQVQIEAVLRNPNLVRRVLGKIAPEDVNTRLAIWRAYEDDFLDAGIEIPDWMEDLRREIYSRAPVDFRADSP